MGRKKICVYKLCNSDSRYADKVYMKGVKFFPFPKPSRQFKKCKEWIEWLGRADFPVTRFNANTYLCSKHFVGKKGPTPDFPNPIHDHSEYVSILKPIRRSSSSEMNQNIQRDSLVQHVHVETNNMNILGERQGESIQNNNVMVNTNMEPGSTDVEIIQENSVVELFQEDLDERTEVKLNLSTIRTDFSLPLNWGITGVSHENDEVKFFKFKPGTNNIIYCIQLGVDLVPKYEVLGRVLVDPYFLEKLPKMFCTIKKLNEAISFLDHCLPCCGNSEEIYLKIFEKRTKKCGFRSEITGAMHSEKCHLLIMNVKRNRCYFCCKQRNSLQVTKCRNKKKNDKSITRFSNLSKCDLANKLRKEKSSSLQLRSKIKRMKARMVRQITKKGHKVCDEDNDYLMAVLKESLDKGYVKKDTGDVSSLFLRTQLQMLKQKHKNRRRWHPTVIQWCLFMYAKSPALFKSLHKAGVMILPSMSTLRSYSPDIGASPGFHDDLFFKMKSDFKTMKIEQHQEYFVIVADEIKIEEDIVYRVETGDVIGYTHLGSADSKLAELHSEMYKDKPLATHVLQFMIRGVTTSFKRPFAYFATNSLTAEILDELLWEAIQKLELTGFKVLGVVGDGAASNRKCFNLNTKESSYKCKNPFAPDRDIYFLFDAPHLIKTTRNCLNNSKEGCNYRLMQINDELLTWNKIRAVYNLDMERPGNLRKLNKLTSEHINLENRMKVKYATQVLSQSVANALKTDFPYDCKELIRFVEMFNKWFDVMNVGHLLKGYRTRNPNINPFTSPNDKRLQWLKNDFLGYLDEWENYVSNLDVKQEFKKKMLLSTETLSGLRQTTNAVLEIIPFLLKQGAKFILTSHLNQDPVEQLFSKHRQACKAGSKPTLYNFCRNDLRLQILEEGKIMVHGAGTNTE